MRNFADRHPFILILLIVVAALGLAPLSEAAFPQAPVGNVSELSPEQMEAPSEWDQVMDVVKTPASLYGALTIALAVVVLSVFGWWREAGVAGPPRWNKLYLLVFPALVVALAFSGDVFITGPGALGAAVFTAGVLVLGEELLFRGVLMRALAPAGALWAVALTSALAGGLYMGRSLLLAAPWTEVIYVTVPTVCGGFTYGALRWRTASLWPVLVVHFLLAFALDTAVVTGTVFPVLILSVTLGFVFYGLFLLRNQRVRADGGPPTKEEPARVV